MKIYFIIAILYLLFELAMCILFMRKKFNNPRMIRIKEQVLSINRCKLIICSLVMLALGALLWPIMVAIEAVVNIYIYVIKGESD